MGISEFNVHNVLRTYARQDRLGKVRRAQPRPAQTAQPADRVSLSPTGRKVQWVGQLAAAVVDRADPEAKGETRAERVRSTKEELLRRHRDEIGDSRVSPEAFEANLTGLYLGS